MSMTSQAFGEPQPGWYWIYYIVKGSQELETALQNYPVVLMFWASWNEPSKVMMKPFRDMALAKKDSAVFCRVDVDKFKDFVARYRVEALPTFVVVKNGREQRRVVGAKVDELNTTIKNSI